MMGFVQNLFEGMQLGDVTFMIMNCVAAEFAICNQDSASFH